MKLPPEHTVSADSRITEFFRAHGFVPVNADSYPVFRNYDRTAAYYETTSVISTVWAFAYDALYKVIDGFLCSVWFYDNGGVQIIVQEPQQPRMETKVSVLEKLYGWCREAGLDDLKLWPVTEDEFAAYQKLPGWEISAVIPEDWSEYVFTPADITDLAGGVNLNKRNRLKKCFAAAMQPELVPLARANFSLCLAVEDAWCAVRDCADCMKYSGCEKKALLEFEKIFDENCHKGLLAFIDGRCEAYLIYEQVNPEMAVVFFAKANISDLNLYLYYLTAKNYLQNTDIINIGPDLGKNGLKTFKRHLGVYSQKTKRLCSWRSSCPKG